MGLPKIGLVYLACCLAGYVEGQSPDTVDPCVAYREFDGTHRSSTYQSAPGDPLLCDNALLTGWYRFNAREGGRISENCVPPYHCGTQVPIWMSGTHPTTEETVDREVCMNYGVPGDCCSAKMPIKVKKCTDIGGSYYVYFLQPTTGCSMAYCMDTRAGPEQTSSRTVEKYGSLCYKLSSSQKDHHSSGQDCAAMGGGLALIKDTDTQSAVANHIIRHHNEVSHWIGVKAPVSPFLYDDWEPVQDQQLWAPNQPPTFCVFMDNSANYKFTVGRCSEQHPFVCQSDIGDCGQDVCLNGGTCSSCFGETHKMCNCRPGYTGDRCETNIDECASSPCLNGGTCSDGDNSYTCQCVTGYDGDNCEHDIDLCDPNPCPFDWICFENVGVGGLHCDPQDIDECASSPCLNGGTCSDGYNSYTCQCLTGYDGSKCEHDTNGCDSDTCVAVATCTDIPAPGTGAICTCPAGYRGDGKTHGSGCTDIPGCDPNPCVTTAFCVDVSPPGTGAECICLDGYEGDGAKGGIGCEAVPATSQMWEPWKIALLCVGLLGAAFVTISLSLYLCCRFKKNPLCKSATNEDEMPMKDFEP